LAHSYGRRKEIWYTRVVRVAAHQDLVGAVESRLLLGCSRISFTGRRVRTAWRRDLPGPAKDLNASLFVYDDGWWRRRMAHGYGKRNRKGKE
jgi:hypothetical protein